MVQPTDRVPAEKTRLRRLQSSQNEFLDFIGDSEVIQIVEGVLVVDLQEGGGLVNDAGELAISALFRSEMIGLSVGQSHMAMAYADSKANQAAARDFMNMNQNAQTINTIQANADKAASMAFFYGAM